MTTSVGSSSDRAIVVGIQCYPKLTPLQGPENDAIAFKEWLVSPSGGKVPASQVELILSSDTNCENEPGPLKSIVERAFEELVAIAAENDEAGHGLRVGRRLYLYFSGHGYAPMKPDHNPIRGGAGKNTYVGVLMANATKTAPGFHIPVTHYADHFRSSGMFDEVLAFMDCCQEDYRALPLSSPPWAAINNNANQDNRHYLYSVAASGGKLTRERLIDGRMAGIFTTTLLEGLAGGAADKNGNIMASGLHKYLVSNMWRHLEPGDLADNRIANEPAIESCYNVFNDRNPHDFSITTVPAKSAEGTVSFEFRMQGVQTRILGHDLQPIQGLSQIGSRMKMQLEPGFYVLETKKPGTEQVSSHPFEVIDEKVTHVSVE